MSNATFESFVKDQKIFPIPEHPGMPWMGPLNSWFNQLEWIRDEHNKVVCDCLRLEHIEEDIGNYFGRRIKIAPKNITETRYDYRSMYNSELTRIIGETFSDDIDYFGFEFESAATKNISALG
jgi:hypothetical protein